jgi:hypothetical protein
MIRGLATGLGWWLKDWFQRLVGYGWVGCGEFVDAHTFVERGRGVFDGSICMGVGGQFVGGGWWFVAVALINAGGVEWGIDLIAFIQQRGQVTQIIDAVVPGFVSSSWWVKGCQAIVKSCLQEVDLDKYHIDIIQPG